jgi:hypothetical protein
MHLRMHATGTCLPTHNRAYICIDAYVWPRRIKHPPSASASPRRPIAAESGAYPEQRRHRRGVPRADVRVERRRPVERLRAEPHAVHADGKCSKIRREHTCVRVRAAHTPAPKHTNTHTRTHKCARARTRTHTHTHTHTHTGMHAPTQAHPPIHIRIRARAPRTRKRPHGRTHVRLCMSTSLSLREQCIDRRRYTALSVRTCVHAQPHGSTRAHMRTPIAHVPAHRSTHTHTHR